MLLLLIGESIEVDEEGEEGKRRLKMQRVRGEDMRRGRRRKNDMRCIYTERERGQKNKTEGLGDPLKITCILYEELIYQPNNYGAKVPHLCVSVLVLSNHYPS